MLLRNGNNRFEMIIFFIFCWLYSGLRYRVGTDSAMYNMIFDTIPPLNEMSFAQFLLYRMEPLFLMFVSFCKWVYNDYLFFQLISSFIINYTFFELFRKYSNSFWYCILVYILNFYLLMNCEFVRQSLAISFFYLLVFPQIEKNKILYYGGAIVSLFIHSSMAITLLFPFISWINVSARKIILITIILFIVTSFFPILSYINQLMPAGTEAAYKLDVYSTTVWTTYNFNFLVTKIITLGTIFYFLIICEEFEYRSYIIIYAFSFVLSVTAGAIFERFQYVLCPFYILLIGKCIGQKLEEVIDFSPKIIFILALSFFPTYIYMSHAYTNGGYVWQKFFPYYSYLNKEIDKDRELLINEDALTRSLEK